MRDLQLFLKLVAAQLFVVFKAELCREGRSQSLVSSLSVSLLAAAIISCRYPIAMDNTYLVYSLTGSLFTNIANQSGLPR